MVARCHYRRGRLGMDGAGGLPHRRQISAIHRIYLGFEPNRFVLLPDKPRRSDYEVRPFRGPVLSIVSGHDVSQLLGRIDKHAAGRSRF